MKDAEGWRIMLEEFLPRHPIVVGEWCMSTGTEMQVSLEI